MWRKQFRHLGRTIKRLYYVKKYKLKNVHSTFYIGGRAQISSDLVADAYTYIGANCTIYPKVKIGAYSMLASHVSIIGGDHTYTKAGIPIIFSGREVLKNTYIGRDCWIGSHSIIMVGVTIGDGTIVGAGTIVTKDLEPFSIYCGVPAKKIKKRFNNIEDLELHKKMIAACPDDFPKDFVHLTQKLYE